MHGLNLQYMIRKNKRWAVCLQNFKDWLVIRAVSYKLTSPPLCATMSVSYTHLDVYKRQG